jgi:hypothetical protein
LYEYKFVEIELKQGFLKSEAKENYRKVIQDHAKEGWRWVQIFAPGTGVYGSATKFELIFEREIFGV